MQHVLRASTAESEYSFNPGIDAASREHCLTGRGILPALSVVGRRIDAACRCAVNLPGRGDRGVP